MTSTLSPWPDLLARRFRDTGDQYGPNSQVVTSAFSALSEIPWLTHVGEPLEDDRITVVRSWDEALKIFDDNQYNLNGVLQAAYLPTEEILHKMPEGDSWWQSARTDVEKYVAYSGIPDSLPQEKQDLLFEHLWEFVSMLLVEIIAAPEAQCTYFREQLAWFHAGRFPCGWDGAWPGGRMRVF